MKRPKPAVPASSAPNAGCTGSEHPIDTPSAGGRSDTVRLSGGRTRLPGRLFSVPEAADQLGISEKSVRRAIDRGDLVKHRIGRLVRISEQDLAAFVALRRMQV